jgi:chemotaxis protein histidine kinase CheA
MKIWDSLLILLLFAGMAIVSGCQEKNFEKNSNPSASIDAEVEKDDGTKDNEQIVSEPIAVGGAFLYCAMDNGIEVSSDENSGLGCRLTDENDRPIVLKRDFAVTTFLTRADGSSRELQPSAVTSIYWHWVYEAPTNELVGGSIKMTSEAEGVIWGEAKTVAIAEADNDLQNQLDLVYAMIADHEAKVAELQAEADEAEAKWDTSQTFATQAEEAKLNAKDTLDSAEIQYDTAKDEYAQAMSAVASADDQLATATNEKSSANESLVAAKAALADAEQALADAATEDEIDAAEAERAQAAADVQAAETNLAEATQKEADAQQALDSAINSRDNTKVQMDSAKADRDTAKDNYRGKVALHTTAEYFLERAQKVLDEATEALEKVTTELEALRAEAERLKTELENQ